VTPKGITKCTFPIAVDRDFKVDGEKVADFFRIQAWRQLGDICYRHLSKGRKVAVIGELHASTYPAKDGATRMSLDVVADKVEFLSPKPEAADNGEAMQEQKPTEGFTDISSDDIPF
jgi:single-strand DNA-binding protein